MHHSQAGQQVGGGLRGLAAAQPWEFALELLPASLGFPRMLVWVLVFPSLHFRPTSPSLSSPSLPPPCITEAPLGAEMEKGAVRMVVA